MPGKIAGVANVSKRKRKQTDERPSKRLRSESSEEDRHAQILLLENQIFESKKHYNNIATLIKLLKTENQDSEDGLVASISLCRIFSRFLASGQLIKGSDTSEKDAVVIQWLRERFSEYKNALIALVSQENAGSTALTLCMRILKSEGTYLRNGQSYNFPSVFLTDLVRALLTEEVESTVRREFSEKYVEEYDDIRFYTFEAVGKVLSQTLEYQTSRVTLDNALDMLSAIESVPESKDELEDFYIPAPKTTTHSLFSLTGHKKHAQEAWLALMSMEMDKDIRKRILGLMTASIAPWFIKSELLMDFLTDSYNAGGSTSLLALSGVFYLIREKNLDYPSFYLKLYSLLDVGILHSKHRSRFFRLLDTFLSSTHLPAVLVASFIKRLSRLTLFAPPAGVVAVVPWIYNLLKKHPTCTFMIHRETIGSEAKELLEEEGLADPFLMEKSDPMETKAIESSLWEIVMLQSHYHPNVATLAKIISEQFTKHAYNLEDFLDHSYASMLEAELSKEVKKAPVVEYEIPKRIFMNQDEASGVENSLVVRLWDFS